MNLKSICSFSPIMSNHLFAPSRLDMAFAVWHRSGLVYFQDLFSDDSFVSFTHLCRDHNIPKSHFFRYLQARSFASKHFPGYPCPPSKDLAHSVLNVNPFNKGAVSFWASVFRSLSAISGRILSPNPQTAIFGTVDTGLGFSSLHKNAVAMRRCMPAVSYC
ncbi:hypothetical protein F7725_009671 [Dissostichus mawsoni]|uniref:Uncharacterized protein n=1 Tax=Dissostichus mawsoni TaxID=36200 RepID=A0A7J5XM28_DISMA|nr:hypothetical protein F7725_009671 [Dissostichus mawsoni]